MEQLWLWQIRGRLPASQKARSNLQEQYQGEDMNFSTQNLDEPVEGVGIIHCFDANFTFWKVADWFWHCVGFFFPSEKVIFPPSCTAMLFK